MSSTVLKISAYYHDSAACLLVNGHIVAAVQEDAAFTYFIGFTVNEGEYKVMGLAPYGEALYVNNSRDQIVEVYDDGSIRLNLDYFEFEDLVPQWVVKLIAEGKVIGLFQGQMEFGPRAFGFRSILGDARSPTMQSVLNLKIKGRESFRPFAPAVLREHVADWFELDVESPYMLLVADVAPSRRVPPPPSADALLGLDRLRVPRSTIPAVTHVNNSARIQTVRHTDNPLYYDIIRAFYDLTGCPVVVNTSFNVRDEPIVCTPEDAYRCFMKTEMVVLVMESYLVTKTTPVDRGAPKHVAATAHT